jgi:hypothetical protein
MSETTYLDTETAYWVIPADDAFSIEVVTPWDDPTTVSPFVTAADVKVWIAEHRRRVQSESKPSEFRSSITAAPTGATVPEAL